MTKRMELEVKIDGAVVFGMYSDDNVYMAFDLPHLCKLTLKLAKAQECIAGVMSGLCTHAREYTQTERSQGNPQYPVVPNIEGDHFSPEPSEQAECLENTVEKRPPHLPAEREKKERLILQQQRQR